MTSQQALEARQSPIDSGVPSVGMPANSVQRRFEISLIKLIKATSLKTGLMRFSIFNIYKLMHEPHQLEYLLSCLRDTDEVPGACLEIGCAQGATTIFLKKYLRHIGSTKRYFALDTFSGFQSEDVDFEVEHRGKGAEIYYEFINNHIDWVAETLRIHEIGPLLKNEWVCRDLWRLSGPSWPIPLFDGRDHPAVPTCL